MGPDEERSNSGKINVNAAASLSIEQIVDCIFEGAQVALPTDVTGFFPGIPIAVIHAIISRKVRNLHIVGLPSLGYAADLLIGAGCVASAECGAFQFHRSDLGMPPRAAAAFAAQSIEFRDATCPALHARFQAGEKRIPFIPLRGMLGSDLLKYRTDWKVIDNPFAADDPIVVLPAIIPDIALIHAPYADAEGNVFLGQRGELKTLAHAAKATYVTVERRVEGNLMADDTMSAAMLSSVYVSGIAVAFGGAAPYGMPNEYLEDSDEFVRYAKAAVTEAGFAEYLEGICDLYVQTN